MHLLAEGITKIIRIGGRSQVQDLEGHNLRVVSRTYPKTTVENTTLGQTYEQLEKLKSNAGYQLRPLHQLKNGPTWEGLKDFLKKESMRIYLQLAPKDDEGFVVVGGDRVKTWLGKRPRSMPESGGQTNVKDVEGLFHRAEQNIKSLSHGERWILVDDWIAKINEEQNERLFEALEQTNRSQESIQRVYDEINRRVLVGADVIGITTTGLARNIEMLRRVRPKVVICEEAAEVMEAHIISAFMPGVEHIIQIGDHRQLRPQINNYSLSLETATGLQWQLDRSQFERRAMGESGMRPAPVAQLDVQRRMRPEISRLIRTVYPNLRDHEKVLEHPPVVGMRHNLFWLQHNHPEESRDDGSRVKSHSNDWEVGVAAALVRHLVRQGAYSNTDIALLTPYTGQLKKLRAALRKDFEIVVSDRDLEKLAQDDEEVTDESEEFASGDGKYHKQLEKKQLLQTLRVATVDNFQGEEAKIIIVSLVRSNQKRKVGFLRTENRINVLLSRAQHGMYLIGNAETYLHVDMWADVHSQLSEANAVGDAIPLCCPRHRDTEILCSTPDDFVRKSPEGGCNLPCVNRLEPCGHRCQARCHSQAMHDAFLCPQPCPRIRKTCQHACPKLCGDACGPCEVPVFDTVLPCGHLKKEVRCHQALEPSKIRCTTLVAKTVPGCGHSIKVECYKDVAADSFRCPTPCDALLTCGHKCPGSCGRCRRTDGGSTIPEHMECAKICDRSFGACSHRCARRCHQEDSECGTCENKCEVSWSSKMAFP